MKKLILLSCFLTSVLLSAQVNTLALLPYPNEIVRVKEEPLDLNVKHIGIYVSNEKLSSSIFALKEVIQKRLKKNCIYTKEKNALIRFYINNEWKNKEHYMLSIDANQGIVIKAASSAAAFYAVMTLDQLFLSNDFLTRNKKIASVFINDKPRFSYRGLMLDPARHFIPIDDVKFYIDIMSKFKYNVLQLHLTDDQGWRFEVKNFPKLASKQYYTQSELKDLVSYAAKRHVEIIPELDVPGHTVAFLSVYPELACSHQVKTKKIVGKTVNMMLCASKKKVYDIYDTIIKEVSQTFTSKYIHLGGDEAAIKENWDKCFYCKRMAKKMKLKKTSGLMSYFFNNLLTSVRKYHKKAILWCELNNIYKPVDSYLFPYPKDVTLVSWRGGLTPSCLNISYEEGHRLIMAPGEFTYFDYPQYKNDFPEYNNWGMPITTLRQSYSFDPGYGEPLLKQKHIWGVMGTLWGEAILDVNRATYMTYPRGLALAEAGWTKMKYRKWDSFKQRLYPNLLDLMKRGVSVRVPFEIVPRK